MKKFVLFDLDGTSLPIEQDVFVKLYFGALAKKMVPYGYDPGRMIEGVTKGVGAMVGNDVEEDMIAREWGWMCSF